MAGFRILMPETVNPGAAPPKSKYPNTRKIHNISYIRIVCGDFYFAMSTV